MILGFSFKGVHSSIFGIGVRSEDRSLLPEREVVRYTIPGLDGTIKFDNGTYKPREISMRLGLINKNWHALREQARLIAEWLQGDGQLIFDDEPDKFYDASVYTSIKTEQINLLPIAECSVVFECQPFAKSLETFSASKTITVNRDTVSIASTGSASACCEIEITNNGIDIPWIIIYKEANGEEEIISFPGMILGSGQKLKIDTCGMTVMIDDTNAIQYMAANSNFFKIMPGTNVFTYRDFSVNRNIDFKVTWKDSYY